MTRVWATLNGGEPYELRDLDGNSISHQRGADLAAKWAVPEHVRRRARARSAALKRGRLTN